MSEVTTMPDAGGEPEISGAQTEVKAKRPVLIVKYCRGRLGGSALLLAIIQRARWSGREVIAIDGDEASKTLRSYYPAGRPGAATIPPGADAVDFKDLMLGEMAAMVTDRKSRVVDFSGGSRDMDEVMFELNLPSFCDDYDIDLIAISMLGPDLEDFQHVIKAIDAGYLKPENMLLVMNQGVLRGGNLDTAFVPILDDPRFQKLCADGALKMLMPRLPVMSKMREALVDVYQVASGRKPDGSIEQPVWSHMSKRWLADLEQEYADAGITERLP